MCLVLKLSVSSYYSWLKKGPSKRWLSNREIIEAIELIFEESYHSYGSPRMTIELNKRGFSVSRVKVARMMRELNLQARRTKRFVHTTNSNHRYPISPNLLNQDFSVTRKNQVWVSDITYIETLKGWSYLTVIIDLFDRKVIGWSFSKDLSCDSTIMNAWKMAKANRNCNEQLIFHSDRGIQYAATKFRNTLKSYKNIKQSMSRKGNCWDNAVAESFFKSLKVEWIYKNQYHDYSQAELSVFKWIETWYNTNRRHSALGFKSIKEFELENINTKLAA